MLLIHNGLPIKYINNIAIDCTSAGLKCYDQTIRVIEAPGSYVRGAGLLMGDIKWNVNHEYEVNRSCDMTRHTMRDSILLA